MICNLFNNRIVLSLVNMEIASDIEIVQAVLKGNTKAYSILVDRYQGYVFTLALRVVGTREDAEEVAQDSFIKAYRSLVDFRGDSKFSTWLYTIVNRTSLNFIKKKKHQVYSLDSDGVFDAANSLATPLAANILEQKNQRAVIDKAISMLKPEDAEVITLFYLHEQSLEEIAHILGTEINAAKVRLHRARSRLREIMEKYYQSELKN